MTPWGSDVITLGTLPGNALVLGQMMTKLYGKNNRILPLKQSVTMQHSGVVTLVWYHCAGGVNAQCHFSARPLLDHSLPPPPAVRGCLGNPKSMALSAIFLLFMLAQSNIPLNDQPNRLLCLYFSSLFEIPSTGCKARYVHGQTPKTHILSSKSQLKKNHKLKNNSPPLYVITYVLKSEVVGMVQHKSLTGLQNKVIVQIRYIQGCLNSSVPSQNCWAGHEPNQGVTEHV